MATSTSPLKIARPPLPEAKRDTSRAEEPRTQSRRQIFKLHDHTGHENSSLRMYTEEQVAELLQVSLSKLRKWRMKGSPKDEKGPPFKKIGRLVRYPEAGLCEYINGQ